MKNIFQIKKEYILITLITIIYFFINYLFINNKNILFIATFFYLSIILTYLYTNYKKNFYLLVNSVKIEIKNITWSSRADIKQTTIIVISTVFLTSFVLWVLDSLLMYVISKIM